LQERALCENEGMSQPPYVYAQLRGMGHTTNGESLFAAGARALHWFEVDCRDFGTAFVAADDETMQLAIGSKTYQVRVGRIREWCRNQSGQGLQK
jgi:hypothetical protein